MERKTTNLRRPKVLWAGISEGSAELIELFTALETPLAEAGFYRPEERAYAPHLTLGRLKPLTGPDTRKLAAALAPLTNVKFGEWNAETVNLYQSELLPAGSRYTVLREFKLRSLADMG